MNKWVNFQEIKDRVTMADVLGYYGLLDKLQRKGDNLVGACPIHGGKNKSQFHVSLSKNNFNCFGDCHAGGNVLDFVGKMEKVELRQAALLLQEWFEIKPDNTKETKKKEAPSQALKENLSNPPLAFSLKNLDKEHHYLKERGLQARTIDYFGLGYCRKGLMKDRVAIPIHNELGELVAYLGRWPGDPPKEEPKYKLPKGFHKSLVLFNFHQAKESTQKDGLILVEGVFDCLKVWQAGFPNVAALLGSSLSSEQEDLIVKALGPKGRVLLMFDQDSAGCACRAEVLNRLSQKLFVKVIDLGPEGAQPDSLTEAEIKEKLQ